MTRTLCAALALVCFLAVPAEARKRHASPPAGATMFAGDVVATARQHLGNGAIYGRSRLWCARFMNYVLKQTGHRPTGSDLARSFLAKPRTSPRVGAIAVMGRRGGGHVGVVTGFDARGNPIIISGNHRRRVAESVYPARRIIAYVQP